MLFAEKEPVIWNWQWRAHMYERLYKRQTVNCGFFFIHLYFCAHTLLNFALCVTECGMLDMDQMLSLIPPVSFCFKASGEKGQLALPKLANHDREKHILIPPSFNPLLLQIYPSSPCSLSLFFFFSLLLSLIIRQSHLFPVNILQSIRRSGRGEEVSGWRDEERQRMLTEKLRRGGEGKTRIKGGDYDYRIVGNKIIKLS